LSEETSTHGILEARLEAATEVEVEPDTYARQIAVLATVAQHGTDHAELWQAFNALGSSWRPELLAAAQALQICVADGVQPHPDTLRSRLSASLSATARQEAEAAIARILDPSAAVDASIAAEMAEGLVTVHRVRVAIDCLDTTRQHLEAIHRDAVQGRIDPAAATAALEKTADDLLATTTRQDMTNQLPLAREVMAEVLADMERRSRTKRVGLDYGLPNLNVVLATAGRGLFVFGGLTAVGKSSFLIQLADHVAEHEQIPVLYFTYEQSAKELATKSLARRTARESWPGIDTEDLSLRPWKVDRERVAKAAEAYCAGPGRFLHIIEAGADYTVERIRLLATTTKRREERRRDADKPPCLVCVDYLQAMPAETRTGREFPSVRERVDFILGELARLARDLDAPVLVLSSINRASYNIAPDKSTGYLTESPELSSFKESGGIEYGADLAMLLAEDKKAAKDDLDRGRLKAGGRRIILFCLKKRSGPKTHLQMDFYPAVGLFSHDALAEHVTT